MCKIICAEIWIKMLRAWSIWVILECYEILLKNVIWIIKSPVVTVGHIYSQKKIKDSVLKTQVVQISILPCNTPLAMSKFIKLILSQLPYFKIKIITIFTVF